MQKPSSPVSSGNISPAIVGPSKDTKEVYVIGWVSSGALPSSSEPSGTSLGRANPMPTKAPAETLTNAQVANVLKTSTTPPIEPIVHSPDRSRIQLQVRQHPYGYLFRGGPQGTHRRRQSNPRHAGRLGEERSRPRHSRAGLYRPAGLGQLQHEAWHEAGRDSEG